jgi:hypothetical protein
LNGIVCRLCNILFRYFLYVCMWHAIRKINKTKEKEKQHLCHVVHNVLEQYLRHNRSTECHHYRIFFHHVLRAFVKATKCLSVIFSLLLLECLGPYMSSLRNIAYSILLNKTVYSHTLRRKLYTAQFFI